MSFGKKNDSSLPRTIEERLMKQEGLDFVIGVDEAGRGPLAGSVMAGACVYLAPCSDVVVGVTDSKQIDEENRDEIHDTLLKNSDIVWSTGEIDNYRIDEINVLQATFEAMTKAVENLLIKLKKKKGIKSSNFHILIDGNKIPPQLSSKYSCTAIIKGDGKEFIIAAASVFAKVTRDRIMYQIDKEFPQYGFGKHKGYGTAFHFNAVHKYGPCKYHRFTFAPIKHMNLDHHNKILKQTNEKDKIIKYHEKNKKK